MISVSFFSFFLGPLALKDKLLCYEEKKLGLGLGDTDYKFSFPVKDTLVIFRMEIDNNLDISGHVDPYIKCAQKD